MKEEWMISNAYNIKLLCGEKETHSYRQTVELAIKSLRDKTLKHFLCCCFFLKR